MLHNSYIQAHSETNKTFLWTVKEKGREEDSLAGYLGLFRQNGDC